MAIWSAEIKVLETLYGSVKSRLPDLEKELGRLIKADDENILLLYSRRCLEVIISDLCEYELNRPRKTEPLKGIIDKLHKEEKVPSHIISSMYGLNELSVYGAHPKDYDPEQVKPVLNNLAIITRWYLKYKGLPAVVTQMPEDIKNEKPPPAVSAAEKSIAVLPFLDMSPEKDQDYFCDGITEEIINALAHIENFKVIARTSAFAFKNKQVDIREIGNILNVGNVLEGSIRKAGTRLRITAQLIKVSDGSHIWSERYDREIKDVFAIQDEISLAIAGNLKIKLFGEAKAKIANRHSEDLEAYNMYLKGTYNYQLLTVGGLMKASEYFKQALQKDPCYALAFVGLGYVHWLSSMWGNVPPDKAYPEAEKYVKKALEIDGTLAEAYSLLATINTFYFWNWSEAEKNFRHALRMNPNSSMLHTNYSVMLIFARRYEEAINEAKKARELDPLSPYINTRSGMAYYYAGQYDKASEEYRMILATNPDYFFTRLNLAILYQSKGMFMDAAVEYDKAAGLSNGTSAAVTGQILAYYKIGKKDKAEELFSALKKRSESEYVPSTFFFMIFKFLGEEILALGWLKKACSGHDTYLTWTKDDPEWFPEGSRYRSLIREAGL